MICRGVKILFLFFATVSLLLIIELNACADSYPVVGRVHKIEGAATIAREGQAIQAKIGSTLWQNDTLSTGSDGSIGLIFNDDSVLSLGPNSVLVIDDFIFAPKQGRFSMVIRMLKGTAAYLSGLISKFSPESVHFQTPSASIGIRGTKFVVKVKER